MSPFPLRSQHTSGLKRSVVAGDWESLLPGCLKAPDFYSHYNTKQEEGQEKFGMPPHPVIIIPGSGRSDSESRHNYSPPFRLSSFLPPGGTAYWDS